MDQYLVRLSKTISRALRHAPEEYGLTLDKEGWVAVADLLRALHSHNRWSRVSEDDLAAIMAQSDKQRFEIRDDRIRAYYGHSILERVERETTVPPEILYHGTTAQAAAAIRVEGLKPMKRQHVHLSADQQTARIVALRRTGQPVILRVAAGEAHQKGIKFYLGNESIWLADTIPAQFIDDQSHHS
jgi:putative RNA 2'-phosphotransferase